MFPSCWFIENKSVGGGEGGGSVCEANVTGRCGDSGELVPRTRSPSRAGSLASREPNKTSGEFGRKRRKFMA